MLFKKHEDEYMTEFICIIIIIYLLHDYSLKCIEIQWFIIRLHN